MRNVPSSYYGGRLVGKYNLKEERDRDINQLERDYYRESMRRKEFYRDIVDPLIKEVKSLSINGLYRFWGHINSQKIVYEYNDGGISKRWVEKDTMEHMYTLPDTDLPIWVVKEGLDPKLKNIVMGRLEGRLRVAEHRQDYIERYERLINRVGRLGHISYMLEGLLLRRIETLVYSCGDKYMWMDSRKMFSINLNGRRYLYTRAGGLVDPWDVEELKG
jgi:hypothetical protein